MSIRDSIKSVTPGFVLDTYRAGRRLFAPPSGAPYSAPPPQGYSHYQSLATPLYSPWLAVPEFIETYRAVGRDISRGPTSSSEVPSDLFIDGRYIQWSFAQHAAHLDGDFVEIGVHQATASHLFGMVIDKSGKTNRTLWSIDSFEGLSEPDERDVDVTNGLQFFKKHSLNDVDVDFIRSVLNTHKCTSKVIKGWVPEVLDQVDVAKIAFAHIDVDIYKPTREALEFVYDKMVPNGVVLFDDYGFPMCAGVRQAVDSFLVDKPENVIGLPTGQAVFIKR